MRFAHTCPNGNGFTGGYPRADAVPTPHSNAVSHLHTSSIGNAVSHLHTSSIGNAETYANSSSDSNAPPHGDA